MAMSAMTAIAVTIIVMIVMVLAIPWRIVIDLVIVLVEEMAVFCFERPWGIATAHAHIEEFLHLPQLFLLPFFQVAA